MIYDVINPSDPVTIEADTPLVAGLAVLALGHGKFAAVDEDGSTAIPLMLFGGMAAVNEWLAAVGYEGELSAALAEHRAAIAACLRTAMVASISERRGLTAALAAGGGDTAAALAAFNEDRRSSMNNICGRAALIAASYEEGLDDE